MKRSYLAIAGVALMSLLLGACSDDDKSADSEKTTTTVEADSDTTDTIAPTTTVADDEYAATATAFTEAVAAAGDDLCAVMAVNSQVMLPAPTNSEQVEAYFDANFAQLRAVAATRPAEEAAAINSTLEKYSEYLERSEYDIEKLSAPSDELSEIQNDPAFIAAMSSIETEASECAADTAVAAPDTEG